MAKFVPTNSVNKRFHNHGAILWKEHKLNVKMDACYCITLPQVLWGVVIEYLDRKEIAWLLFWRVLVSGKNTLYILMRPSLALPGSAYGMPLTVSECIWKVYKPANIILGIPALEGSVCTICIPWGVFTADNFKGKEAAYRTKHAFVELKFLDCGRAKEIVCSARVYHPVITFKSIEVRLRFSSSFGVRYFTVQSWTTPPLNGKDELVVVNYAEWFSLSPSTLDLLDKCY